MEEEPKACTPEEFAKLDPIDQAVYRITEAWQKQVPAIVETGQILIEEKEKLDHGQFTIMIERRLPFSARTAQVLMQIARHPTLANAQHAAVLPVSWSTLAILASLDADTLEDQIKDGKIHRRMDRKDALALLPPKDIFGKREKKPKSKQKTQEEKKLEKEVEAKSSHIEELEAARESPPLVNTEENELNKLQEADNRAISELRTASNRVVQAKKIGDPILIKQKEKEKEQAVEARTQTSRALKRKKEDLGIIKEERPKGKKKLRVLPGFGTGLDFTICGENLIWVRMDVQEVLKAAIKDSEKAREIYKHMENYPDQRKADLIDLVADVVYPSINDMQKALDSLRQSWEETLSLAKDQLKDPAVKAQAKKPSLTVVPTTQIGTNI